MIYIFIFALSLFIGSFLNVVGIRGFKGEDFVSKRSRCMECGHELSFLDLVPVFSWLFMRGKCRYCGTKISSQYIIGELLTGFMFTIIIYKYGFQHGFPSETEIQLALAIGLIIASASDLKYMMVSDKVPLLTTGALFLMRIFHGDRVVSYVISGIAAFLFMFLIFILSGDRLGGADVKLYAPIGLGIGFVKSMESLFFASVVALIFILFQYARGLDIKNTPVPFVPFITIGVGLTYIFNVYGALYL